MQISRKKTRKFLFQRLFAHLYGTVDEELFFESFFQDIFNFGIDKEYFDEMVILMIQHQGFIISVMEKYAPKFDIDTMNKVTILSTGIGVVEMLFYSGEIPAKVSINESVEIAKVYGDDQSKKIVNGILNSLFQDIEKESISDILNTNIFPLFSVS